MSYERVNFEQAISLAVELFKQRHIAALLMFQAGKYSTCHDLFVLADEAGELLMKTCETAIASNIQVPQMIQVLRSAACIRKDIRTDLDLLRMMASYVESQACRSMVN